MPKAKRAIDVFLRLEVDMILGGHLHRGYVGNTLDVYAGVDRRRGVIICQCGTSTSRRGRAREREKNSFNWVEIDEHVVRITPYMYFHDIDDFARTSSHLYPRAQHDRLDLAIMSDDDAAKNEEAAARG